MPKKERNELAAGVFVVIVVVVTVGVVLWLGAANVFRPARQRAFFSVSESAGSVGLGEGSNVEIAGKEVGKIVEVRLQPDKERALYIAEIHRDDVRIYANAEARVAQGLVGESTLIVINRGSEDEGLADEDNPVALGGGLGQAMADLADTAEMLRGLAETVRDKVAGVEGEAEGVLAVVERIINRLDTASEDVVAISANVRRETKKEEGTLITKVHGTMDDVRAMTADARPKVGDTLTSVKNTAARIEQYTDKEVAEILAKLRELNDEVLRIARDFSEVSSKAKETMLVNREKIDETIDNLTLVSANLKAASTEIRRNPWRLLYRPDNKELRSQNIYDAARAFSSGAQQLDQALTKLSGLAEAHPEGLPADDPQLQEVREQIKQAFGEFSEAERELWEELER
jgi:phospholipid/cholesterol/gamma-HCH transport system substrate-binding protein